jgi:hypothetical protein
MGKGRRGRRVSREKQSDPIASLSILTSYSAAIEIFNAGFPRPRFEEGEALSKGITVIN